MNAYLREVRQLPGVLAADEVNSSVTANGRATLVQVSFAGTGEDEKAKDIVRDIRGVEPRSGTVYVGGETADHIDLVKALGRGLPVLGAVVLAAMLFLMFLAIVTSLISITASFGVVTWIFGEGHLEGLLNFEASGTIEPTQLVVMMVTLFALSMDYEVFLLSRVREEWDACGDNDRAVVVGLQRTGRIITSAALLLGVVIGAFGTAELVVRAMLVPATMKLMGRLNWWAPAPMLRWWNTHGMRH